MFDHLLYTLHLAPSGSLLFLHLKTFQALHNFTDGEEQKSMLENWLNTQAAVFCDEGIQKLVPRYDECLSSGGDCRKIMLCSRYFVAIRKFVNDTFFFWPALTFWMTFVVLMRKLCTRNVFTTTNSVIRAIQFMFFYQ
jgi:hypothetical protein